MTGLVISRTVMVWTQEAVLPQSSVAVQVLAITIGHLAEVITSLEEIATLVSQLSVAVAVPAFPITQSKVVSRGEVITGAVLSRHKLS